MLQVLKAIFAFTDNFLINYRRILQFYSRIKFVNYTTYSSVKESYALILLQNNKTVYIIHLQMGNDMANANDL